MVGTSDECRHNGNTSANPRLATPQANGRRRPPSTSKATTSNRSVNAPPPARAREHPLACRQRRGRSGPAAGPAGARRTRPGRALRSCNRRPARYRQPARSAGTPAAARAGATSSTSWMITLKPALWNSHAQVVQQALRCCFQTHSDGRWAACPGSAVSRTGATAKVAPIQIRWRRASVRMMRNLPDHYAPAVVFLQLSLREILRGEPARATGPQVAQIPFNDWRRSAPVHRVRMRGKVQGPHCAGPGLGDGSGCWTATPTSTRLPRWRRLVRATSAGSSGWRCWRRRSSRPSWAGGRISV